MGTHPRAPPPAPKLQIFKLYKHATVPQSQLLRVVGAQCSQGSHQTLQALLAAPSSETDNHLRQAPSTRHVYDGDKRDLYKEKDAFLASWTCPMVSVGFIKVPSPS